MEPLIYDQERVKLFEGALQALLSVRRSYCGKAVDLLQPTQQCSCGAQGTQIPLALMKQNLSGDFIPQQLGDVCQLGSCACHVLAQLLGDQLVAQLAASVPASRQSSPAM
jgi:isopentenyl phosphate kinase